MLVLLPPSEGKASSGRGAPLKLESLSLPRAHGGPGRPCSTSWPSCARPTRRRRARCSGSARGCAARSRRTRSCATAGARPAGEIYTGVLYDALDLASLDTAAKRRAGRSLLVFSGLWGAVRVTDRIPSYRCSMGVTAARARRAGRALAYADGGGAARGGRATGWCWTCGRRRTRRRGSRRARWPGGRRRYGCCTRRPGRSSATSTRRPRGRSSGVC